VPAFQTDGKLAYGIQHTYFLDATGEKILSTIITEGSDRRAAQQEPHYNIGDAGLRHSHAAGPMFTMMSYQDYFSHILVHVRRAISK